ncbi:hypothetical protein C0J52_26024 [Blattella germanica]|nr:hypothetical protein C0J52_26024 [Blattella germanica]
MHQSLGGAAISMGRRDDAATRVGGKLVPLPVTSLIACVDLTPRARRFQFRRLMNKLYCVSRPAVHLVEFCTNLSGNGTESFSNGNCGSEATTFIKNTIRLYVLEYVVDLKHMLGPSKYLMHS